MRDLLNILLMLCVLSGFASFITVVALDPQDLPWSPLWAARRAEKKKFNAMIARYMQLGMTEGDATSRATNELSKESQKARKTAEEVGL